VIIFALICALLISLSLIPMLASRLLKKNPAESRRNKFNLGLETFFTSLDNGYQDFLRQILNRRWLVTT